MGRVWSKIVGTQNYLAVRLGLLRLLPWLTPNLDAPRAPQPGDPDPFGRMTLTLYNKYLDLAQATYNWRFLEDACPRGCLPEFTWTGGRVAEGAFGRVYIVAHPQYDEELALKVQQKDILRVKLNNIQTAIDEKKIQFALQSKFTVRLLCAFQDMKNIYMVLERAEFGDLENDLQREHGIYSSDERYELLAAQLILGLEYLHRCKILHRDMKPENVLIFGDGYVKIADFGLSKQVPLRTNVYVGSKPYMAPELLRSEEYGAEVDWWGLGIILYKMTQGWHPFWRDDRTEEENVAVTLQTPLQFWNAGNLDRNDFIWQLLAKTRLQRLGTSGSRGAIDVKAHPWLESYDFLKVINKEPLPSLPPRPRRSLSRYRFDFEPGPQRTDYGPWNAYGL